MVPNYICVFFCGIPLFLLEVSIGQYLSTGGIAIWNIVPIFKGVGFASMVMIGLCNIYYIILLAWALFYLFNSFTFTSPLPWSTCNNTWNTDFCLADLSNHTNDSIHGSVVISPVKEYWEHRVLGITDGIHDMGELQWEILICLLVAWIMVYGVIWRGLNQSGKIVWFTALFPYVILFILFIRGVTLEGASKGILFYLTPEWKRLTEAKVWVSAGTQVLFSYGIGIGANIALGSYNRYHHNFYRDSIIACCVSSGTSLFSGFVIFSILGHMAHIQDVPVGEVAKSGPGLAFLAYPEVVTKLPISPLWAILFFLMLLFLGIDSQFCTVEAFITGVVDEWPRYLRPRRKLFTLCVVIIQFILGIPLVMGGGMYVFQLMDFFSASGFSLLLVVFAEIVGLCWVFGATNIYKNMTDMLGFRPLKWFYYCWVFFAPLIIGGTFLFSVIKYEKLVYADTYEFPLGGELLGWAMALSSVLCIPLYALYFLFIKSDRTLTLKQRFLIGITPNIIPRKDKDTVCIEDDSTSTDINVGISILPSVD